MNSFLKLVNNPFKFRLFLFYNVPAAFFSGLRIKECTDEKCITSVPFKWLTQNPFKSTYFASLAMAAEMSTGALALRNTFKQSPGISILVTKMEAQYLKKATSITFFTCEDGLLISGVVDEARRTGAGKTVSVKTIGRNETGELVAEFLFTWSFKIKVKN
ncbi:MAG: DUF4442 domain-containing protein [Ginsengibacter sp.]